MIFYTLKICLLSCVFIYLGEITHGQVEAKVRFIDSVVTAIDSMKSTSRAISEGTIRPKYKTLFKKVFKKRAKGHFADWFVADSMKLHLLKVFSEIALSATDYTTYYFLNDTLIYVKLERLSPLQKGAYYFENGLLIYTSGQPVGKPAGVLANAGKYVANFKQFYDF